MEAQIHRFHSENCMFQYRGRRSGREAGEEDRNQITKDDEGLVEFEVYLRAKRSY